MLMTAMVSTVGFVMLSTTERFKGIFAPETSCKKFSTCANYRHTMMN